MKPRLVSKSTIWPVLTTYNAKHLGKIAMPIGGIGTGTVSLGGRGDLRDWEICNRPAKGFAPRQTFFAISIRRKGRTPVTRALEGPLELQDYEGAFGSRINNHGLPRFRNCTFHASYPLGQVLLTDPDVPISVRLKAWNPLIPGDADRSGFPVAILSFELTNASDTVADVSVCGNLENFIGFDGREGVRGLINASSSAKSRNFNTFRESKPVRGLFLQTAGVDPQDERWGTLALTTTARSGLTHRTHWADLNWGDSLLDYWDDFSADGGLDERKGTADNPMASLAVAHRLPAGATRTVTFLLTWHFPNRYGWSVPSEPSLTYGNGLREQRDLAGNYYCRKYADAWHVAETVASSLPTLERDTLTFVSSFVQSDLPQTVKEAALNNLSTLRTQTTFRIASGHLMGWEGCGDLQGCCFGSCTHVWNYEHTTPLLFGALAKTMREVEFIHSTRSDGLIAFRADLNLERAREWINAAADGQMGCLIKLYREWQLSGDDHFLRTMWPAARSALEFCWRPGGWDADQDGVMEGCQHNTMDVEYYGPNPQMGTWYLGALRAMQEMSRHLGDTTLSDKCARLFQSGSVWLDAHLFNGEYYEHEIRAPAKDALILPGLRVGMGANDLEEPDLQLGAGCLIDQLVGQAVAHACGLGYLLDQSHVKATLQAIMKHNYRRGFQDHFNHLRSFVLGDESALLMATYPRGRRPRRPFPYFNEVMTGFEYTAAVGMLYEGLRAPGLAVIKSVRERYDGHKRNPFDEAECGHHYARAMAAWGAVLALTGFHYSAVTKILSFGKFSGTQFWSNGYAWGTCCQLVTGNTVCLSLKVLFGELYVRQVTVRGHTPHIFKTTRTLTAGRHIADLVLAQPV